jgi:hypothetical protein
LALGIYGTVGLQNLSTGAVGNEYSQGRFGEMLVSEVSGRYYNLARNGNIFSATAIVTAPVIYTTAAGTGGPLLWNNNPSVNAVLLGMGFVCTTVTTVAAALGIATGATVLPTSTTAIDASGNLYVGGSAPTVNAYRVGTVSAAANNFIPLASLHTGALTVDNQGVGFIDLGGLVVVPYGKFATIAASATASTTVAQLTLIWAEVPA